MELELRRSEGERRLYLLDGIGTLRLTNLLASTGVAEEDGRRWSFGKRGLLRSVVRATDEAGVEVGEFAPRRARRAGSLRWDGHELTLRPASKWRSRYALVSGEQELATVEAKGWAQASGRSHALRGRSAGARPCSSPCSSFGASTRTKRRLPAQWPRVDSGRHVRCLASPRAGYVFYVLRKLLWTGLYAGIGAGATVAARRVASRIWRVATGEEPPTKK